MIGYWLYTSAAVHTAETNDALPRILRKSLENNANDGITGFLVYGEGRFVQLVEGPPRALGKLMSRIAADRAHYNLRTLDMGQRADRLFPVWDLGVYTEGLGLDRASFRRLLADVTACSAMDLLTFCEAEARSRRNRDEIFARMARLSALDAAQDPGGEVIPFPSPAAMPGADLRPAPRAALGPSA